MRLNEGPVASRETYMGGKRDAPSRQELGDGYMSIQYVLEFPCRVKKELGEEHIVNLVNAYAKFAPKRGVGTVETAVMLDVPPELGGTVTPEDAIRKDMASLEYYVSDCLSCPANVTSEGSGGGVTSAFGCLYELKYPISTHLETILMNAAFAAIEDPNGNPGYRLLRGIVTVHPKGRATPAHKVRRMGTEFFEAKAPKEAKIEVEGKKVTIDTDQLMMIIMQGPVPPQAGPALAAFLESGVERARVQGLADPRIESPLVKIAKLARVANKFGKQIKVTY